MLCPKCGQETADGSKFCGACGGAIEAEEMTDNMQEKHEISEKITKETLNKPLNC